MVLLNGVRDLTFSCQNTPTIIYLDYYLGENSSETTGTPISAGGYGYVSAANTELPVFQITCLSLPRLESNQFVFDERLPFVINASLTGEIYS